MERRIIAAGSIPVVPALPGIEAALTSDEILFLPVFPRRLVIVGAGAIGLEMAGAFSDFGAEVVVVGQDHEILPAFDRDVAGYLRKILESRGVTFHLGATLTSFSGRRGSVTARFTKHGEPHEVTADQACVAIGRRWTPEALGAEHLGPRRGHLDLEVTPHLRTSVAHIYAAGDAAGNAQLTPVAAYEGRLAAHNALQGDQLIADTSLVPQCVFTTPEVSRVGLTHRAATASGVKCHVATHDLRGASNGRATGEDDGYVRWESVARRSKMPKAEESSSLRLGSFRLEECSGQDAVGEASRSEHERRKQQRDTHRDRKDRPVAHGATPPGSSR